ncbi:uncharacterized protein PRCAT00004861001 [Priceomyces carsonii]|uniref:uncharacterized protein n=1 Tax=Priceomyces carsonii TaxID=28549 RepID=UPI002EDA87C6|nr:unnamed protein product [Priceomyces carsonii]
MSEIANKITGKTFSSKSIDHISSYKPIKDTSNFLLSFGVVNYFYQQLFSVWSFVNENIIAKYSFILNTLNFVDEKFESIVLGNFDSIVKKLPDLSGLYPTTLYSKVTTKISTGYLKPTNTFIYNTYDKYLPATATDNKLAFKLEDLKDSSEITKFFKILNEFLTRSRLYVSTKSGEVSGKIVSSFNQEKDSLKEKSDGLSKNVIASYNTGYKTLKNLNEEYIKPLKSQTQGYVVEVATSTKNKADSLLSDAKLQINPKLNNISAKGEELLNGKSTSNGSIPVVSASA